MLKAEYSAKTVNTIALDAIDPSVNRSSTVLVLTMWNKVHLLFKEGQFQQSAPFECGENKVHGLSDWGRVKYIGVSKSIIIGLDNGLLPGWGQAIICTNAGISLIEPLGTKFREILIITQTFSFKEMHLKMSSSKRQPFCLGLNVLTSMVWALILIGIHYRMMHELTWCDLPMIFIGKSPHSLPKNHYSQKQMYYFISYMLFHVLNTQCC